MYHVSAQGLDERIINVHHYYYYFATVSVCLWRRFERLTSDQLRARYPQFTTGPNTMALFQKDAGLVDASLGNATHVQLARGNGAVVIDRCPVLRIRRSSAANLEVCSSVTRPEQTLIQGTLVLNFHHNNNREFSS